MADLFFQSSMKTNERLRWHQYMIGFYIFIFL